MRVVIYGAGGIGGVLGGCLTIAGYDAVLIGRPGHMNAIRQNGLRLIMPTGTKVVHMETFTRPDEVKFGKDDVVFLSVKGQSTEGAMVDLQKVTKDVPIFCFQNGISNEETVARYFRRVYGVRVQIGATFVKDGEVICRRDPPGWLVMGCYPTGTDKLVETVAANLRRAEFLVKVTPDVMPYKWGKLMRNLVNATVAITNERGGENKLTNAAVNKEARDVLARAGIRWVTDEELEKEWPERSQPPRGVLPDDSGSSTWQSLTRRQGTVETDFLNGEIVRAAKRSGITAPLNEKLLHICLEMAAKRETPGKYTPAELSRVLGLG